MSLQDLGSIGEFVGAIGVVVSLVYLALQIRHNSRHVRAASTLALQASMSEFLRSISRDSGVARLLRRGLIDFRDLDEDHFVQFNALMVDLFSNFEACYLHQREGLLEDAIWQRYRSRMTWYLAQPGGRRWWETWGVSFSEEFSGFVAEEIADTDKPGFGLHLDPGRERGSDSAA